MNTAKGGGYAYICVHLLFIMQRCSVPVQCVNSTRGSKEPYAAKATFGEAETSLKAQAEQHEVSSTLSGSDAVEENASNSPVLAIVTKTVGQHITLLPPSRIMQSKTEKETTLKTKKRTLVASTRTSITAAPTTTTTTPSVARVTNTPQVEKEAKAATSAAVVGGGTEPKQDQQDVSTEEPDDEDDEDDEEPDENTKDTKIPIDIARSTIASHLDEKLYATVSTTHYSNESDDMEGKSQDSVRDVQSQSPDSKGPAGIHKKKANVGAAVLLVCGVILSLLLSILVVLISMMISAQKNPRLRSTMQSATASSAAV